MKAEAGALLLGLLSLTVLANAEIEKGGNLCDSGVCVYWWPRLPPVTGWHQDMEVSRRQGVNALAPDGSTFNEAETVMYGTAATKAGSEAANLEEFIAADMKGFAEHQPGSLVTEVAPLTTGDGLKLRSFTFFPKREGNWERVAFGEEGEYFLVFTVSSRTQAGYEKALPIFAAMLKGYKENP